MFYIAIWPILLVVIQYVMDEESKTDHLGKILRLTQIIHQLLI